MEILDLENEELLGVFFEEAQNLVDILEENIMSLEDDPNNSDTIDEIFRAAHTLKGSSASLDMMELSDFTHIVEDVFDAIRDDKVNINNALVDLLLSSLDIIKEMLALRLDGKIYLNDISDLKSKLKQFLVIDDQTCIKRLEENSTKNNFYLSKLDLEEIKEGLGIGQKVLRISVIFNTNSDSEVENGGLKIFNILKNLGSVLHTIPKYEQIIENKFLARVDYYLIYSDIEGVKKSLDPSSLIASYLVDEFNVEEELKRFADRKIEDVDLDFKPVLNDSFDFAESEISDLLLEIENQKLFKVRLYFVKDNPMATISGLQMLQALKSLGKIFKSIPDSSELLTDKFFNFVIYYLISNASEDSIVKKINLPDVVSHFEIENVDLESLKNISLKENNEVLSKVNKSIKKNNPISVNLIRIDSKKIDYILNLVSEAVISKSSYNQINSEMITLFYNFNYFYDYQESFQRNFLIDLKIIFKDAGLTLEDEIESHINSLMNFKMEKSLNDISELRNSFFRLLQNFKMTSGRLSRIITDLHESVLKTRMLPISNIFSRFTRVVRDLSKKLNKLVNLEMEGEETELDKSVIDDLVDPLMHCVRNSMDHGLETAEERVKKGKNKVGTIILRAKNEGNVISIEIEDDGIGIDPKIIRRKLIEKGTIKEDAIYSDFELINLIFAPGFSTAVQVTDLSGRGVGLDVVKKSIEKLNGTILVESEIGIGTIFRIKLPLTLVIIQGLLVKSGSETYVIPLNNVLETHRITEHDIKLLENYHEVYNLRDEIISVLRLDKLFNITRDDSLIEKFLIVVNINNIKTAIVVDSILGEEDFVVKPIKDKFSSSAGIVGATTLGNGKVVLIIDVFKLFDLKKDTKE
ncbi:chemotaxis protein CheA [Borreliella afzelii]|uniref:Chemotaxis protein CheA n=2 Tax=Borreliella afzelii TaxID=29518 RepID=Q0SMI4_BORAP|nr:chemotaxis protein CheA [Borreliella afzelii]ABH01944.1 chemotaxis histidine kinase [Borreliella afzelii PKo]AEL69889.1 chemotaxis histidine kinase [Borreliella afzelii PKo]MBB5140788.1 two-component system chemotaxis sensor kinase CheA [Borreliella afzelii]